VTPPVALAAPATPAAPAPTAAEAKNVEHQKELAHEVALMGYDPDVTQMLTLVVELREVKFDVTQAARLSLTDPGLATRQIQDLNAASPGAQENAAELVELVTKAKVPQVQAVFRESAKMKDRSPYLDFVLLTAMNTRGRDFSEPLLIEDLKHPDFMVRQTTALLFSRMGDPRGLAQLFEDLKNADAAGCSILNVALEELLGNVLGGSPQLGIEQSDALARKWKENAEKWWNDHRRKLEFKRDTQGDGPCWTVK
jgi:HEAT repeat protein